MNDTWTCPKCGATWPTDDNFCGFCGTSQLDGVNSFAVKNGALLLHPDGSCTDVDRNPVGTYNEIDDEMHIYYKDGHEEIYDKENHYLKRSISSYGSVTEHYPNGYYDIIRPSGEVIRRNSKGQDILYISSDGVCKFQGEKYTLKDGVYVHEDGRVLYLDENDTIIVKDTNGNKDIYDKYARLVQSENANGDVTNYEKHSITRNIDGKLSTVNVNHIEYDEEAYDKILHSLVSIGEYSSNVSKSCSNLVSTISSFPDPYTGTIGNISGSVEAHFDLVNSLKEMTNYSVLAYQGCDQNLRSKVRVLIDSLFDDKESSDIFKRSIGFTVEDRDNDSILEYKHDTNFKVVNNDLAFVKKVIDENGNALYLNKSGNLVAADGKNIKMTFGNETFTITFGETGCVKLLDSNGKPLNVFGEYNLESEQYGGNQMVFSYNAPVLLQNPIISKMLSDCFPDATSEEKMAYLHKVCENGCCYVAMSNVAFKMMEGYEDDFYNKFGFPMYNVKYNNGKLAVDYNYEPVVLELYSEMNGNYRSIKEATIKGDGTTPDGRDKMYEYLCNKYNIDNYNETDVQYVGDNGYSLYYLDGNVSVPNGGSHAMIVTETIDGEQYVSSWGKKFKYKPSGKRLDDNVIFSSKK